MIKYLEYASSAVVAMLYLTILVAMLAPKRGRKEAPASANDDHAA